MCLKSEVDSVPPIASSTHTQAPRKLQSTPHSRTGSHRISTPSQGLQQGWLLCNY